jgi:hypothetical protein
MSINIIYIRSYFKFLLVSNVIFGCIDSANQHEAKYGEYLCFIYLHFLKVVKPFIAAPFFPTEVDSLEEKRRPNYSKLSMTNALLVGNKPDTKTKKEIERPIMYSTIFAGHPTVIKHPTPQPMGLGVNPDTAKAFALSEEATKLAEKMKKGSYSVPVKLESDGENAPTFVQSKEKLLKEECKVTFEDETQPDILSLTQPNDFSIAHHFQSDDDEEEIAVKLKPEEIELWENFKALHVSMRSSGTDDGINSESAQAYAVAQDNCIFPVGRPSNFSRTSNGVMQQLAIPPMYMSRNSFSMDDDPNNFMRQSTPYHPDPMAFIPNQQVQVNQQDMLRMSGGDHGSMAMSMNMCSFPNMQSRISYGDTPMVPVLIDNPSNMLPVPVSVMNPPTMLPVPNPTDAYMASTMDVYPHLRVSNHSDGTNQLFPTGNNIQIEQVPYMNPTVTPGMRGSYDWSIRGPMM